MSKAVCPPKMEESGMEASPPVDLRRAFGTFATGVAIVTTRNDGVDVGMTINSFSSVSLEPPLVSWNLRKSSPLVPAFLDNAHFAVHILSAGQIDLSRQFTRPSDRFAGLALQRGTGGIPILTDCCAVFECNISTCHDVGDHIMLIGKVLRYSSCDRQPLLFHGGQYGQILQLAASA